MKIAICASEGAPYAKSGGLGDVMEALPSALARIAGNEVVLFLPYYHKIKPTPPTWWSGWPRSGCSWAGGSNTAAS